MTKSEIIESVSTGGIPLYKYGEACWALTRHQALIALRKLKPTKVGVVGGDMYQLVEGKLEPNGDSWYFAKRHKESDEAYSRRTIDGTRRYILMYENFGVDDTYFTLILEGVKNC
ncbi:MAG: hypothetical protein GY712_02365 [Oceanicoccus sp.]|uniref:Imm40 family immunity protein n=1 Tax=Oceanicoccus sp. TaxID=2691044 RepID=UPI002626268F|nr:Imm40 family immunity protein [Oceanicoccus sp.]MCP3906839.1 hypothetical protein [Oceanicoccus sp.]MDG1772057.1 Imm40 family immunity protein [Oceanicoccus sp.]